MVSGELQDPGLSIADLGTVLLTPIAGYISTQPALLGALSQATLVKNNSAGAHSQLHGPRALCGFWMAGCAVSVSQTMQPQGWLASMDRHMDA